MIPTVDIRSNIAQVQAGFGELAEGLQEKAIARALNRAGDQSVTEASRRIREIYSIKAQDVKRQFRVIRRPAKGGVLRFTVRFFGERIPLIAFGANETRKGITVRVKRGGGGRQLIAHAFKARMKSGHIGVFLRAAGGKGLDRPSRFGPGSGTKGRRWGAPDSPITELFTLDVPTMFNAPKVTAAVVRMASESFTRNFEQQLKFLTRARTRG